MISPLLALSPSKSGILFIAPSDEEGADVPAFGEILSQGMEPSDPWVMVGAGSFQIATDASSRAVISIQLLRADLQREARHVHNLLREPCQAVLVQSVDVSLVGIYSDDAEMISWASKSQRDMDFVAIDLAMPSPHLLTR
jgi:hypothetical protein